MKKMGYLTAPPRRSAALNASAIVNCIFDRPAGVGNTGDTATDDDNTVNIKQEPEHELDQTEPVTTETVKNTKKLAVSSQNNSSSTKLTVNFSAGKTNKLIDHLSMKKNKKLSKTKSKKQSTNKIEQEDNLHEISELSDDVIAAIGGRRMASLNASAMMHASFGREEKRLRRDPLTIAIEASLKDMKDREEKIKKETEDTDVTPVVADSKKSAPKRKLSSEITVKKETVSSPAAAVDTVTSDNPTEADLIKTKLIESARIKSKLSRHSSEDKLKKKKLKNSPDKHDEKIKSGNINSSI